MARWQRILLFLLGLLIAAGGTAYFMGLIGSGPGSSVTENTATPDAPLSAPMQEDAAEKADRVGAGEAASDATDGTSQVDEASADGRQDRLVPSSFDLLRVEPDGSVLVAGKAGPKALVELLQGEKVLGSTAAGEEGDFVVVLDEPLPPGDYQLALRTTVPGEGPVLSTGTAVISIPQSADGQVLAMVDEPGSPAQLVTVPKTVPSNVDASQGKSGNDVAAATTKEQIVDTSPAASGSADVTEEQGPAAAVATAKGTEEAKVPSAPQQKAAASVVVEAVEIEGDTIFVAGSAAPGHNVRVYADADLLGETTVSDGRRFLVEAKRDLAVGNYMIRADLIDKDGNVVARAIVPFDREPGEAIAAIAAIAAVAPVASPQTSAQQPEGTVSKADAATQNDTAASKAPTAAENEPAAADEATTAAPLERADGAVIIRRGDSLWRISRRVYGHGIRYSTIYLANQDQIRDPDLIWPGQVFALPGETPEGDQADLEAIGDQAVEPETHEPSGE